MSAAAPAPTGRYHDIERFLRQFTTGEWEFGLPLNSFSGAYESVRVVKAGPGMIVGFHAYSSNASAQFVQLFDAEPVNGAVPPGAVAVAVWAVAASSQIDVSYIFPGRWFGRGCILANSSTGPTYMAGAADTWFDAQYI